MSPLPPGSTIGILGNGQLGRMLALAGARLGLKTHVFGPGERSPAGQVSEFKTVADYDDESALRAFGEACDVITYEWESIPIRAVEIAGKGKIVAPNLKALATAQDRLTEKTFLRESGLKTADFAPVGSRDDLEQALSAMGGQGVLKTRRFGYDGKGQAMIRKMEDADAAWDKLGGSPLILESFIPFLREVSVVAARAMDGRVAAFPLTENIHQNHILHESIAPTSGDEGKAGEAARTILNALDYVGVIGVEFFDMGGELLVNEIAPRVHNSGHWTQDGGCTDQFEQHMRAVAGWPLGNAKPKHSVTMTNLIGEDVSEWTALARDPEVRLHLYGKREIRPGRKMGHYNRIGEAL